MNCTNHSIRRVGNVGWASVAVLLGGALAAFGQSDGKLAGDAKADSKDHPTIRIRAGSERGFKDSQGNTWLPDKETKEGGFKGGDTIERPDLKIENTKDKDAELYRAEHYSMDSFSWQIPNGKYIIKLHFCETFDGIGGPGDRVFSYKVQDKEFKDFDVWKKTGGPQRPYVETVNVDVTDGKLKITFTPKVENPQINGLEIIPAEKATAEEKAAAEKSKASDKTSSTGPSSAGSAIVVTQPPSDTPVRLTSQEDHQRLMDLLGISTMRQGANGNNPQAANAANYDESKANPYPTLPDPLVLKNGQKVTTAEMWWQQRRPEIVEDFDREIYGRVPKETPKVTWEVTNTTNGMNGDVPIITKTIVGHVDNSSYPGINVDIGLTLTVPANAAGPVPVMMVFSGFGFGFGGRGGAGGGPPWQKLALASGWGYAAINTGSIQADSGGYNAMNGNLGLTGGIIGLCNKGQPRKVDDWGVLRAWGWGASRALDYFETDKSVDAKQVGLEGHSRWGKATLVAMAYDPRFAIAYVSSSGEGGAKLHRRNWGELVENVAGTGEYHWMAGNFLKYAGPLNWNDMPVDSHELIAMCAPRPVFISGGATNGDGWVDAKGSFLAAVAAGPVYKLLGKTDLGTSDMPEINTGLVDGDIAFRQHSSGHVDGPNWPVFLEFAQHRIHGLHPALAAAADTASSK
jgi:Malectin domain